MKRLLDKDDISTTVFHEEDGKYYINRVQDVEPIIDDNKVDYNNGTQQGSDMRRVASIPLVIVDELMRKGIWGDPARLKVWLNDPDNRLFRTSPERV